MVSAVLFALVAMLAWGVWAVLADAATQSVSPTLAVVVSYGASTVLAVGYLVVDSGSVEFDQTGIALALLSGVFGGIGVIGFYAGLQRGGTGVVTTVSALYFVVAAVLGVVFLEEPLALRDVAGVACAVVAVVLLSG
jgi:transporter family protein